MEEVIKDFFIEAIKNYGVITSIVTTIVFVLFVIFFNQLLGKLYKILPSSLSNSRLFSSIIKMKERNLSRHIIFKKLNYLLNSRLPYLNTTCPLRKAFFQKVEETRINLFTDMWREFIKTNFNELTPQEFKLKVLDEINKTHLRINEKCLNEGVPKFLLEQLDERVHKVREAFLNQIKGYCFSQYLYSDNIDRLIAIFDLLIVYEEYFLGEFESMLDSFNGEINGTSYNGVSCLNCEKCVHEIYLKKMMEESKKKKR